MREIEYKSSADTKVTGVVGGVSMLLKYEDGLIVNLSIRRQRPVCISDRWWCEAGGVRLVV